MFDTLYHHGSAIGIIVVLFVVGVCLWAALTLIAEHEDEEDEEDEEDKNV